jgi:hypothetical protein
VIAVNFIAWVIVACEIAFWVVIGAGLFTRYIWKWQKLGLFFLALTPVVDFILLCVTTIDLYKGATATIAHGIATVYIGVSVAFGKSMIKWADERFQYYVLKQGEKPRKLYGREYAKNYFKGWVRHVMAYMIGASMLLVMICFINDIERTMNLFRILKIWTIVLVIDFIITMSYFIWPKQQES